MQIFLHISNKVKSYKTFTSNFKINDIISNHNGNACSISDFKVPRNFALV